MEKNYLIIADLEGASGLTYIGRLGTYPGREFMTDDVNAAALGLRDSGATDLYLFDRYNRLAGDTVIMDRLQTPVTRVNQSELYELLNKGKITAAVITGAHAKNGTLHAFADYTHNDVAWNRYTLNGREYGDIGIAAVYLGVFNVPVIAVSGDYAACAEAKRLLKGVTTVSVKRAEIRNCVCESMPIERAHEKIRTNFAKATKNRVEPYLVHNPYVVKVHYNRTDFCDDSMNYNIPYGVRINGLIAKRTREKIQRYGDLLY